MKKKFYQYMLAVAFCLPVYVNAQQPYVHHVVVLNEGQYDYTNEIQLTPVTIATYNPISKDYNVFDTIPEARFGSDVIVNESHIYIAADTLLLEYDKFTLNQTNSIVVKGIRKLAFWSDKILVTRGELGGLNSYFQVYELADLSMAFELDTIAGPKYAADGIAVLEDTAYIAVNNSFEWGNYKSLLGLVDLNTEVYEAEIDLGPDAVNPENIMVKEGELYVLNNKDFSGSSITSFNTNNRNHSTTNVAGNSSCGASALVADHVFFMEYSVGQVARYNVNTQAVIDTLTTTKDYYGIATDTLNQIVYATYTDFTSYGKAYVLDYNAAAIDSFDVGVSPGNMAFDIRTTVGYEHQLSQDRVSVFPNPVNDVLYFSNAVNNVTVKDVLGNVVLSEIGATNSIKLFGLPTGIYLLEAEVEGKSITKKVIKQ